ncbi:MAG: type IV pilin protein [Gammaproteobacteria bacterium]|nr:type IV pilin protein [Gammaproteobacteria bacterium]
MRQRKTGFTLIELMITVAVVGILAAIAYPSYMDSVRKSRRSDAINDLSAIALAQEKWRANYPTYATNLTAAPPTGLGFNSTTSGGYYNLSFVGTPNAITFTIKADAVTTKSQYNDTTCRDLQINQNGPVIDGTHPAECWKRN